MHTVNTDYFKHLLTQRNITNVSLAKGLGIDPSAASRMLNGKRGMYPDEIAKLASMLGVTVNEVMRQAGISGMVAEENTVKVIGRLTGTGEIEMFGESRKPERIPAPLDVPPDSSAIVADTGSSQLELMDGWTFYIGQRHTQAGEFLGRQVMAQIVGARRPRLGWLKRSHRAAHFNLITSGTEGEKGVLVEWVAPVIWIKP